MWPVFFTFFFYSVGSMFFMCPNSGILMTAGSRPGVPRTSESGLPARMFSSTDSTSGVSDHRRSVESREHDAIRNGRLG